MVRTVGVVDDDDIAATDGDVGMATFVVGTADYPNERGSKQG